MCQKTPRYLSSVILSFLPKYRKEETFILLYKVELWALTQSNIENGNLKCRFI